MDHSSAHNSIAGFFTCWSLPQAITRLTNTMTAATTNKIYKGRNPAELVYFIDQLMALIKAGNTLVKEQEVGSLAIIADGSNSHILNLTEYSLYCGWAADADPWDYFPRHLSTKEFLNPYKAIKKVLQYKTLADWEQTLKELLQYALSNTAISDFDPDFPLFQVSNKLYKLVEACHLVDVRAINEDENGPRPKWKNKQEGEVNLDEKSSNKLEAAYAAMNDFFDFFGKNGAQECLWEILKRALCNDADETPARDRSNMMFVYDELKKLIAQVYVMHKNKEVKKSK